MQITWVVHFYALQHASESEKQLIRSAILTGGLENIDAITNTVKECGALEYTMQKAREKAGLAKQAIDDVSDSIYKEALMALCDLAVQRNH